MTATRASGNLRAKRGPTPGRGSSWEGWSTGNSKPDQALLSTLPKGVVW